MCRYKLQPGDYEEMWLILSPEEIRAEFQDRAYDPRNIRRIFKKDDLRHQEKKKGLTELKNEEAFFQKTTFEEALKDLKQEAIDRTWARIKRIEKEWRCM